MLRDDEFGDDALGDDELRDDAFGSDALGDDAFGSDMIATSRVQACSDRYVRTRVSFF